MKYLVIGAGGTGGSIGAFMTEAGKDITVIARGKHLEAIQKNGLKMETTSKGNYTVFPMKAWDMNHYNEQPDVIFHLRERLFFGGYHSIYQKGSS